MTPVALLSRVERFLQRSGIAAARIGRDAVKDPRLVFDMRRGRVLRPKTERRLVAWLDEKEAGLP